MNAPSLSVSPTSPANHRARGIDVVGLLRESAIFRDYQQAFQTATGLPLVLRSAGSFSAPLDGARNIAPFCALMAAKSRSCAACLRNQQSIEEAAVAGPCTRECFAGLNDSAVPLRLGDTIAGYLQTGQVMFHPPSTRRFLAASQRLAELDVPVDDAEQLRAAYFLTRVIPRTNYDAVLRLLASFAAHLSLVANGLALQQAAAEPPAVTRARGFIAQRLGEELSLREVAAVAHMSTFYFCKVFKTATGLTLTDYIARARIERVKELLLNPHMRVSEAAFAAGFQSLSQFNRVFRRVTGESPSDHRLRTRDRAPLRPAA
ncbi:MAG: helix-turn-helix domain-containing protein [Opitutaceae bacterium]